jgi:hypothetical protein
LSLSSVPSRSSLWVLLIAVCWIASAGVATAATFPVTICGQSASEVGDGLTATGTTRVTADPNTCPGGLEITTPGAPAPNGAVAGFKVTAPVGIVINGIHVVGPGTANVGDGKGWWGEFYWNGGPGAGGRSAQISDAFATSGCCSEQNLDSRSVGWFVQCAASPSCVNGVSLVVSELDLVADEETAPNALPTSATGNLWVGNGWVRGKWPASVLMSDPSGVCSSALALGDQVLRPLTDQTPDRHVWQQCSQSQLPATFDTSTINGTLGVGLGQARLTLFARNAAGVAAVPSKTVDIDDSTPTVSLSGPTDAPSTAGVQHVTATAGGSPSGIADIICSVDGGPAEFFPGASAQVPVDGIGQHAVSCVAQNNAVDVAGVHGQSPAARWSLKIGQPTLVGIAFTRLVGLSCHRSRVRVIVAGHWITITRHGRRTRVKTPATTKVESKVRCRPRTIRRRTVVFVRVRRHGRTVLVKQTKVVRVVVAPHVVANSSQTVAYGRSSAVSGWLGTASGQALGGHLVQVLTAPDNGLQSFTQAATAVTAADGSWTAHLPTGPSRVVEAVYAGDPITEGTSSGQVRVLVPARIRLLRVSPSRVRWGGTVRITGQLLGGYLPARGAVVRLRIGIGRSFQTYGVQRVGGSGRFTTTYTFGAGLPSVHRTYFFQVATLPSGDYPYAPGSSGRRSVAVGVRDRPNVTRRAIRELSSVL